MCANDAAHTEAASGTAKSSVTKTTTCAAAGEKTYTAMFTQSWATTQTYKETIAALGHNYGAPTYKWNADHSSCTATRVCANDATHTETASGTVNSSVTKPATASEDGEKTYTATFSASWASTQTYKESIPKLSGIPMTMSVGKVKAKAGDAIVIPVSFDVNPGVAMIEMSVEFDSNKLTLVEAEAKISGDFTCNTLNGKMIWFNDTNCTSTGEALALSFKVAENADEGEIPVSIRINSAANLDEESLSVSVNPGGVTVINRLPGDVNGDGNVTGMDILRLKKWLVGMDVTIEEANADVNGDGNVTGMDILRLKKWLVGMDVQLQ